MSKNETDCYMQDAYKKALWHKYHTETNIIFNGLIPDGWDIIDDFLIIIKNERLVKDKNKGRNQLFKYYDNIEDNKYKTYLILGIGCIPKSFRYIIYDSNKEETNLSLNDIFDMVTSDNVINKNDEDNNYPDIKKLLKLNEIDKFHREIKKTLNSDLIKKLNDKITDIDKLNIIKWDKIKISDYFEIVDVKPLKASECEDGEYPLISSSKINNGICKFINTYSIEGDFISVAIDGSAGYSFYQSNKFSITSDIILLRPLKEIDYHLIAILLTEHLHSKYPCTNELTNKKLMNEIINVPIFG